MEFNKKVHKYILILIAILVIVPFIINESYKTGKGYTTMWNAEDILQYFGTCISAVGTVVLGVVAYMQNEKMHKLNEKITLIEQRSKLGYFLPKTSLKPIFSDGIVGRTVDYPHNLKKGISFFNGGKDDVFLLSSKCYYEDKIIEENKNINMFLTNTEGDFNTFFYEPNIPKKDLLSKDLFSLKINFCLENLKKYQYTQVIQLTLKKIDKDTFIVYAVNFEIQECLDDD